MRTLFVMLTALPLAAAAQGRLDITLYRTPEAVEVRVTPHADFDGVFSSLVFTLRCSPAIELGAVANAPRSGTTIAASGPAMEDGTEMYQVFTGFGFTPLAEDGVSWEAGEERTLCTIPYEGVGTIDLVNDGHTASHNGDYYVSLNGLDRTGAILEETLTSVGDDAIGTVGAGALQLWPVPATDHVNVSLAAFSGAVQLEVIDAYGRVVKRERTSGAVGRLDLEDLAAGRYMLRATQGAQVVQGSMLVQ